MVTANNNTESSFKEQFRQTPIRMILTVITVVNWFIFFAVSIIIGGDAIGTTPSQQGFVVTSHGDETLVTEGVWLFSLYYPLMTLAITPLVFLCLVASELPLLKKRTRYFTLIFLIIWATGWYYALIRDSNHSILDYLNM